MEQSQDTKQKKKFDLTSYGIVVGFLCIEVLAFVSFYLGHSFILYGSLSIVLAILALLVTLRQINKDGITTFAFFLFPLFVFGLLTALSSFNYSSFGAIGVAESVFVPITLTFIALAGFLTAYIKKFNIKLALLVIYGALALFVFINLLITMIYYVPFYTLIYKNSYIFYDGKPSPLPIGSMGYMLFGFKIEEVSLEYWSLFPSILLTAAIPLFFIKYKENRRDFVLYAIMTFIAALSLLFTVSKYTLISDLVLVAGIAMIISAAKFHKTRQVFDIIMTALMVVLLVTVIVLFVIAQTDWGWTSGIRNAIAGNKLFNRLFIGNRFANGSLIVFQDLISSKYHFFKLFGVPVGGYDYDYPNGVSQKTTGLWPFDNILSSGLFGATFFILVLVIGIRRLFKYIKYGEDPDDVKYSITGYILGFIVISILLLDITPLVNSDKLFPIYTSAPLLITIFLMSYAFNKTSTMNFKKLSSEEENKDKHKDDKEEQDDEILAL